MLTRRPFAATREVNRIVRLTSCGSIRHTLIEGCAVWKFQRDMR